MCCGHPCSATALSLCKRSPGENFLTSATKSEAGREGRVQMMKIIALLEGWILLGKLAFAWEAHFMSAMQMPVKAMERKTYEEGRMFTSHSPRLTSSL